MSQSIPTELLVDAVAENMRLNVAIEKLRASLEECLDEETGLYAMGLEAAMADFEHEDKYIDIADGIEERARAVLAETESP